jgi:hypothetical protein
MRRTEGREAVRMAMFLNILNRWESAELNQEEAAERPCPPPRPGTPNRSPRRVSSVTMRSRAGWPSSQACREPS